MESESTVIAFIKLPPVFITFASKMKVHLHILSFFSVLHFGFSTAAENKRASGPWLDRGCEFKFCTQKQVSLC